MLPTTLILTRHGETVANEARRFSGHADVALTRRGRSQARALGRRLRNEPIGAAYASDLVRARATAEIALRGRGVPLQIDPDLRELGFGDWEGQTFDQVRDGWPDSFAQLLAVDESFCAPGGEPLVRTRERVIHAATEIAARHQGETVLIVAHGGTLQLLLSHLLGMPASCMFRIATGNCSINMVEFHGERPLLTLLNDRAHLAPGRPLVASRT